MRELIVIMPVYNGQNSIVHVVNEWLQALRALVSDFEITVINDGSQDATAERLSVFVNTPHIKIVHKRNEGHGPTILKGYVEAVDGADWIFQADSDDEIDASQFAALWEKRSSGDFVFGYRKGRVQQPGRLIVSICSRLLVFAFCGRAVRDVNVPYRLMRSKYLNALLPMIPSDTFATNIAISGLAAKTNARIACVPVLCKQSKSPTTSLSGKKLWTAAFRSFLQSIRIFIRKGNRCRASS